jgi:hypothetical protein
MNGINKSLRVDMDIRRGYMRFLTLSGEYEDGYNLDFEKFTG